MRRDLVWAACSCGTPQETWCLSKRGSISKRALQSGYWVNVWIDMNRNWPLCVGVLNIKVVLVFCGRCVGPGCFGARGPESWRSQVFFCQKTVWSVRLAGNFMGRYFWFDIGPLCCGAFCSVARMTGKYELPKICALYSCIPRIIYTIMYYLDAICRKISLKRKGSCHTLDFEIIFLKI